MTSIGKNCTQAGGGGVFGSVGREPMANKLGAEVKTATANMKSLDLIILNVSDNKKLFGLRVGF